MVRPPANDSGDPDAIEFGIAELDARLADIDVDFPIGRQELAAEHGDLAVDIDASGNQITLREALAACNRDQFDSEQELLNALHPVFEAKREQLTNSFFGRLRALFPF